MMARMRCGSVLMTAGIVLLLGCKGEKNPTAGSGEGGASAGAGESAATTAGPAEGDAPAEKSDEPAEDESAMTTLYVRIPGAMAGPDRRSKYEEPLLELVKGEALGEAVMGIPGRDLTGNQWSGIEIDVYDADKAVPRIVAKLKELGVPAGTVIEQKKPVRRSYPVE